MRVVFMGTPEYARVILEAMYRSDDIEIVGVVSQPDKPVGRRAELTMPPVKESALKLLPGVRIFQPDSLRDEAVAREFSALEPDFIVVAAYGKLLPRAILDIAPCINLHASILPSHRGASPIHETLRRGERWSGVSAMCMEEGLDCGAVLAVSYVAIDRSWDISRLFCELSEVASRLTVKVLKNYKKLRALPQVGADSSHCKKIQKDDALVVFDDASEIFNKFRAYKLWPGIAIDSGLKIKDISLHIDSGSFIAGEILEIDKSGIIVGCKKGAIKIKTLQAPSKNEVDAFSYVNGKRLKSGDILV
ncbi:MAG: methionyl-tRNA formyltransferase [Wolinella sp.]